jgi:hypothetical protein
VAVDQVMGMGMTTGKITTVNIRILLMLQMCIHPMVTIPLPNGTIQVTQATPTHSQCFS